MGGGDFVTLSQLEDTFTRCKKYSSKLDIIHSFIRIFALNKPPENTTMAKYKEYGYDIKDGKVIIPEWETEIREAIIL